MKLIIFLIAAGCFQLCAKGFSQTISLSLKNERLERAFQTIEKQSGYTFFYNYNELTQAGPVSLELKKVSVEQALRECLKNQNFTYVIENKIIVVTKKAATASVPSQNIIITGKVTDSTGPLPGVSVMVKGTKTGTSTDNNGIYKITVPDGSTTLVFSFLGYESKEVPIRENTQINVVLITNTNDLDQIVVVGYGTQKKSDLTGSVVGIRSEELNRNKTTDVLSAMQGKLSGVQIASQSGELGAGINITIRGANSIYGSSTPLFVIDGIPMDVNSNEMASATVANSNTSNPLGNLNPSDIESIEVLKDASAAAIYGSRGANGVVIVTTKAGKAGQTKIDYDGYASFARASKKLDVLSGDEFLEYQKELDVKGYFNLYEDTNGDGLIDPLVDAPLDLSAIPKHNWQDEIFNTGISQSHSISVSGGSKTTTFSGGLGYLGEQGIIKANTNKRYNTRLRVDHQHNDKLKAGFNLNTAYSELDGATSNGGANGLRGVIQNIIFKKPIETYDPINDDADRYISPISVIEEAYKNINLTKTLLTAYGEYKFMDGLSLNVSAGGMLSNSKGKEFYGKETTWGSKTNGFGAIQNINSNSWTITNRFNYGKKFNKDNDLNLMAAYEVNSYNYESASTEAANFPDESTGIDNLGKGTSVIGYNSNRWKNNRLSWIGRANYNLMNRYLFTASFRADGSDKFGANNKWGYFPSAAFAWRVSDEKFMQKQTIISNLKARLSYGVTGNERIAPYQYLSALENSYYAANGVPQLGLAPSSMANPDLKWENTVQYNAGLDFGIIKNKIEITADYYIKQTRNMLLPVLIAAQTGFRSQWQNRGRVDNTGVEFLISSHNINTKSFRWDTDFNIAFNKNKIISLGDVNFIPVTVGSDIKDVGAIIVGQQIGTGYGFVKDGIYQLTDFDAITDASGNITYQLKPGVVRFQPVNVAPGAIKFKDLNGDGVVDEIKDRTVISHSQPQHFGGLSNSFHYKAFDLNFFFEWSYGREILNLARVNAQGMQSYDNILSDFYYNRWTPQNPTNEYGVKTFDNQTARYSSSYYVEDGSYVRFKSLTFGYNLPKKLINKANFSNARIYLSANNLYTWTNYTGFDPEVNYSNNLLSGLDNLSYPRTRSFIVGVNFSL